MGQIRLLSWIEISEQQKLEPEQHPMVITSSGEIIMDSGMG